MWFIGVEVEQDTSAPPPNKILDPPLHKSFLITVCPRAFTSGFKLFDQSLRTLFTLYRH